MATYEVPTPPKSEQRAIAAFLDRETARIDTLVASKERLIELLLEKRTAVISAVVTGKMQVGRNGGNDKEEGGRRKEDRSDSSFRLQPSSFPMKDSGVESLGEIPAHWEVKRIRHVVNSIEQGWSPDCENRETDWDEWGVLKAGCVNRGVFVETEHKALPTDLKPISELEIHEGDLLMSRASGSRDLVGSVAIVPKCRPRLLLCDKIFRLRLDADQANKPFLAYSMNSPMARWQVEVALSGGSGLANNIAQGLVKDLAVAVPTIDEQRAIATFLDQEIARLDALVAKIRDAIDRLKELRTALISAAVTGKIDVRKDEG
jgi:type I restriction enzyme S subunit